ncbi:MAG: transcription/translation regulatory transformer protein RfaH [Anaerolineales bacterium]
MPLNWYALRSKPRKEDVLWRHVRECGFETFYPRLRVNPVNPRASKVRPYFPGYLFIQADLEEVGVSTFQWMPYSSGLVSFGGEPAAVPENLLKAIEARVAQIANAGGEFYDGLQSGDTVLIQAGPFAGYQAIFDTRISGTERVRVLLEFLSDRQVPVELAVHQVQRLKTR